MSLQPITYEVTFDSGSLFVGAAIYDVTNGSPSLVGSVTAMNVIPGLNTYFGQFTPLDGKRYVVVKSVYTDGTFTALDPAYFSGSQAVNSQNSNQSSVSTDCPIVGFVNCATPPPGIMNC